MNNIQFRNPNLTVFESALFRTTSCVIETKNLLLVVDPNWLPIEILTIQTYLKTRLKSKAFYIIFTHSDYDHIIGYGAFPEAQVIASQAFVENKNKTIILQQIKDWDDENYILRNYPIEYPNVDIIINSDGQQLQIGETKLTFYLAPGHNVDGIFTIIEPLGIWIAGDYLSNIEFPYIYHSSYEYEETLNKIPTILAKHSIEMLVTGHGDMAFSKTEILKRKKESHAYIQSLRNVIKNKQEFDFTTLMKAYQFPKIMKQFHEGNIALMKKELE